MFSTICCWIHACTSCIHQSELTIYWDLGGGNGLWASYDLWLTISMYMILTWVYIMESSSIRLRMFFFFFTLGSPLLPVCWYIVGSEIFLSYYWVISWFYWGWFKSWGCRSSHYSGMYIRTFCKSTSQCSAAQIDDIASVARQMR